MIKSTNQWCTKQIWQIITVYASLSLQNKNFFFRLVYSNVHSFTMKIPNKIKQNFIFLYNFIILNVATYKRYENSVRATFNQLFLSVEAYLGCARAII